MKSDTEGTPAAGVMRRIIDSCDSVTHTIVGAAQRNSPLAGLTAPAAPRGIRRDWDAGDADLLNSFSSKPRPIINSCDKVPHMSVIGIVAVSKPPVPPRSFPLISPTRRNILCPAGKIVE